MQASDPGRIVLIYIVMKTSQKLMAKTALAKFQIGIEVARLNYQRESLFILIAKNLIREPEPNTI